MFRSSNASESFQSTTSQFSLEKVCLALQKFHKVHKAQTSHRPTHIVRYKIKEWSRRQLTVARLSADALANVLALVLLCLSLSL